MQGVGEKDVIRLTNFFAVHVDAARSRRKRTCDGCGRKEKTYEQVIICWGREIARAQLCETCAEGSRLTLRVIDAGRETR